MATAQQIKSLIRSHYDEDSMRFSTVALQLAAHEARQGHTALASEIKKLVDNERGQRQERVSAISDELKGLVLRETVDDSMSNLVISDALASRLERIILEYHQRNKLRSYGLQHRRNILLIGPPGTGKTMTARVLAHELHLSLFTIQTDRVITRYMGESSAQLRLIFELIQQERGVFLFDEFDAIGGERSMENDVGEMRRVLNAFLQFVDRNESDNLIVAATNNPKLLDQALHRRFDDILYYTIPSSDERQQLVSNILGLFMSSDFKWTEIVMESEDLCHADIDQACRDAIKKAILASTNSVTSQDLVLALNERKAAYRGA